MSSPYFCDCCKHGLATVNYGERIICTSCGLSWPQPDKKPEADDAE